MRYGFINLRDEDTPKILWNYSLTLTVKLEIKREVNYHNRLSRLTAVTYIHMFTQNQKFSVSRLTFTLTLQPFI